MKERILQELAEAVKEAAGEGYEVAVKQVRKNNGVRIQAISCGKKGNPVSVRVYADQFIKAIAADGMTVAGAAREVLKIALAKEAQECCSDIARLTDRDFILSNVEYRVVNRRLNQDQLCRMPYKDVLDLAAFYYVTDSSDKSGISCYEVSNELLEQTGISLEELDEAADRNTRSAGFEIRTMAEITAQVTGISEEEIIKEYSGTMMYVITNRRRLHGANVIMYDDVFAQLADGVGDDLFILPSSTNEVLALPAGQHDPAELTATVWDVNGSDVAYEQILGYQVYRYNRDSRRIEVA